MNFNTNDAIYRLGRQAEHDRSQFIEHCIADWIRENLVQKVWPDGSTTIAVKGEGAIDHSIVMRFSPARYKRFETPSETVVHITQDFKDLRTGRREHFHNEVHIEKVSKEDVPGRGREMGQPDRDGDGDPEVGGSEPGAA